MEQRLFGSTGRLVPVVGQGTWNIERANRGGAIAALRRGFDLGMTHIDTAEMYGAGKAEEIVGEALAGRRDEMFIVSKVLPRNAKRSRAIAACERTLARLKTDRLDCYLLHWRGGAPLEDTFEAFEELKAQGKILSWGVSNFDVDDLEETREIAGDALATDQVLYHLSERAIEHDVLPWCAAHQVAVTAYSPFGEGSFPGLGSDGGRVLREIAADHNATPRQVALRFLLRHPAMFVVPKAARIEHVEENAGAGDLVLADDDLAAIDAAFPLGQRPRELPAV
ncbi:MAG: aldo/keto reductase [Actinomycetota bacterium]